MLKINCPICNKSFFWTDDMQEQGKCPNPDCEWQYDIHTALKQNINRNAAVTETKGLLCPACNGEISSRFTLCRHCGRIVLGTKIFKKSYFFVAVCVLLILLSMVLKYAVK